MPSSVVSLRGVSKEIDERPILRDIDLEIREGEFVALLGSNGAGKTTLLKIITSIIPPTEGKIEIFGQHLSRAAANVKSRMGLIGHQSMLYHDLSARENLDFFARLYGVPQRKHRVQQMLEAIGLTHRAGDPVKSFSRGMIQRVAIGRALLHDPALILADEPFAGLDAPSAEALQELLTTLHHAGRTIILVNHDIRQSLYLAERAIVLRQRRIVLDQPTSDLSFEQVLKEVA